MKNVIALLRVSTPGQADDDRDGIPRQLRQIEEHCKKHGLKVVDKAELKNISGSYIDRSPEFQRITKRMYEPGIDGIVCGRFNRLFRPAKVSTYKIFEPFEESKTVIYCDLGALDPNTPNGRAQIQLWSLMAGADKDNIKEQMQDGKNRSRRDPSKPTDALPFFVSFKNGQFSFNDQSVRVRAAFEQVAEQNMTLVEIARQNGFKSPAALRIALRNPWCIGFKNALNRRDYGDKRRTNERGELMDAKRRVRRSDPIMTRTALADTPLVPKSQFDRVQTLLDSNHKTWSNKKSLANEKFLGVGLLTCACGEKMYGKQDNRPGKPDYYLCSTRFNNKFTGKKTCGHPGLRAEVVDSEIVWSVQSYLIEPKFIKAALTKQQDDKASTKAASELAAHQKDLAKLEKQLKRARTNSIEADDDEEAEAYRKEAKKIATDVATLKMKVEKLEATVQAQLSKDSIENVSRRLVDTFTGFVSWPMQKKKDELRKYVRRITVENGKAELLVSVGLPTPVFASPTSKYDNFREMMLEFSGREL